MSDKYTLLAAKALNKAPADITPKERRQVKEDFYRTYYKGAKR